MEENTPLNDRIKNLCFMGIAALILWSFFAFTENKPEKKKCIFLRFTYYGEVKDQQAAMDTYYNMGYSVKEMAAATSGIVIISEK